MVRTMLKMSILPIANDACCFALTSPVELYSIWSSIIVPRAEGNELRCFLACRSPSLVTLRFQVGSDSVVVR